VNSKLAAIILKSTLLMTFVLVPLQAQAVSPTYSEFYTTAYKKCAMTAEEQGAGDCYHVVIHCLDYVFECAKKSDCKVVQDAGNHYLECSPTAPSPYDCLYDVNTAINEGIQNGLCNKDFTQGALDVDQPGCGNTVQELGETCDDGNTLDGDTCPSTCKDPAKLCGNGVVDPGEACDAGTENGKVEAGCDIQCKSFPTPDNNSATQTAGADGNQITAENTAAPAGASCTLNATSGAIPGALTWAILLLGLLVPARRLIHIFW